MVSNLAIADIKTLKSSGIHLEPEEIIMLNSLGLDVSNKNKEEVTEAPRVACLCDGEIILNQPTIQSERWLNSYALKWFLRDNNLFYSALWASCHAREVHFFTDKANKRKVRKQINKWLDNLNCTDSEINLAFIYVSGSEENEDEQETLQNAVVKSCPYTELVNTAIAAGLNVAVEQLEAMSRDRIIKILNQWTRFNLINGEMSVGGVTDTIKSGCVVKYYRYLDGLKKKYLSVSA